MFWLSVSVLATSCGDASVFSGVEEHAKNDNRTVKNPINIVTIRMENSFVINWLLALFWIRFEGYSRFYGESVIIALGDGFSVVGER